MSETQIVIGPVRMSYLAIWEPKSMDPNSKPKYSASLIIDQNDEATLKKVRTAIEAAMVTAKQKLNGKIPKGFKMPLRNGDEDRENDEAYQGKMFINASSFNQPGIVDKNRNPILNQDEFYSGCFGYASINFYYYNNVSKGIAAGLNHLMKIKDGDPLTSRISVDAAFENVEINDEDDLSA